LGINGFRATVSSLKRSRVRLKTCPKCGSTDVSVQTYTGYITQPMYVCNSCGFQNTIFLEIDSEGMEKSRD